jgi:hypothetical protein
MICVSPTPRDDVPIPDAENPGWKGSEGRKGMW